MDHEEIEEAVIVVIEPAGGHRPRSVAFQSGPLSNVFERAVSQVAIENVLAHSSDKEVRMAVAVEISHRDPHGVASAAHAGRCRHVDKCAVVMVAKQPVLEGRAGFLKAGA